MTPPDAILLLAKAATESRPHDPHIFDAAAVALLADLPDAAEAFRLYATLLREQDRCQLKLDAILK